MRNLHDPREDSILRIYLQPMIPHLINVLNRGMLRRSGCVQIFI